MKREEKNRQTKRRIMDQALREFAELGYEKSSVNHIHDPELNISKGIIYHYFSSKEELFLACVEETFTELKTHLQKSQNDIKQSGSVHEGLEKYFACRAEFFKQHKEYRVIFFEAVIAPPKSLAEKTDKLRQPLKETNLAIIEEILSKAELRQDLEQKQLASMLLQLVSFITFPDKQACSDVESYERRGQQLLDVLLYGIIAR